MWSSEINSEELTAIISNLSELHQWEVNNSPFLKTMTSRHLYFKIAQRAVGERAMLSRSLKDLFSGSDLSEKALRMRVREMEKEGSIQSLCGTDDGRSKYLMPTEKFYEAIYVHAEKTMKIFGKNFHLIKK